MSDDLATEYPGELHVFFHPYSDCSQRVLLLLAEKEIDAQMHELNLGRNEQLNKAYLRINPKAEVPAIIHNGAPLAGSCDILRYLDRRYPSPQLSPTDPSGARVMVDWLEGATEFHQTGVVEFLYATGRGRLPRPSDWTFYQQHVPHRAEFHEKRRRGRAGSDRDGAEVHIHDELSRLEQALRQHAWLVGDTYSLADIAWFPSVFMLGKFGYSLRRYPLIRAWSERIRTRRAYEASIGARLMPIPDCLLRFVMRLNNRFGKRS